MEILKQQLIDIGKKLTEKGLTSSFSGNLSIRYNEYFLVTPSGCLLGDLTKEDIVLIDKNLKVINGNRMPFSECKMHLEIYSSRHDLEAVIHCNPPKASAFAFSNIPLSQPVLEESLIYSSDIPVVKCHIPYIDELAKKTANYFHSSDVVLIQNHGIVLGAKSLCEAYCKMEMIEHAAEVILLTALPHHV